MRLQLERHSIIDKLFGLIERREPSDRLILRSLFFITLFLGIFFLYNLNKEHSYITPTKGGVLSEGIVGIPRFVNPALAITRADQDVVALLYSGLLKIDTEGNLQPDIAESVTASEDGKTYHVIVKKDQSFHDGTPITARDAIYTIKLVQDPDLKSPFRGNWNDVVIEEINEYEFNVILTEAYSPFIENFTIGIMPQHIWSTLPIEQLPFSQHNTEPIGSGPFSIKNINRGPSGLISSYSLVPAEDNQTKPNLSTIELHFFQNEADLLTAFQKKEINGTAYLSEASINQLDPTHIQIINQPLPRIFALFFNQNRSPALRDKAARLALSDVVDRKEIINEVLGGYGVPTTKPIIDGIDALKLTGTAEEDSSAFSQEAAREILIEGGWEQNDSGFWEKEIDNETETLSLTIKTSNLSLFDKTATIIADNWRALGVEVQVEQYEQTGLVQSVIRTRDFESLLFGLDMNRTQDLYPFWHSSQKDDPGLNIAQYTNIAVDRLLEKTRNSQNQAERNQLLVDVSNAISEEIPAIFLFAPSIAYVVDEKIITASMPSLGKQSDRFMNVIEWYAKTETVWPIFQKENLVNEIN